MGHKRIETTLRYAKSTDVALTQAMSAIWSVDNSLNRAIVILYSRTGYSMDKATYLVAQALVELMDTNHPVREESVKHNDWFNGLVDHILEYEKSI